MLRFGIVDVPPSGLAAALDTLQGAEATLVSLVRASPGEVRYQSQLAIAREFIGLITASTGISAASRVVRTADDLLQQLLLLAQ